MIIRVQKHEVEKAVKCWLEGNGFEPDVLDGATYNPVYVGMGGDNEFDGMDVVLRDDKLPSATT
jgi:hypothetical protein